MPEYYQMVNPFLFTYLILYLFFSQEFEFVPQPVAQLPWSYQPILISKIKEFKIALLYAKATHQNGWSRNQLEINIKSNSYLRQGKVDLAAESIKDPYHFDFLD